mmetsp:Transcript_30534/g.46252  ORF Transcript_30534/g.46252 Transcript_30534/m.46252 type:complete len:321 (+) Transcript_30534:737-1699(+)
MKYSSGVELTLLTTVFLVRHDEADAQYQRVKGRKNEQPKRKGRKRMMESFFSNSQRKAPIPSSASTPLGKAPSVTSSTKLTPAPTFNPTSAPTLPPTAIPTIIATTSPTVVPTRSFEEEWLHQHNVRREAFYDLFPKYNITMVPLQWSGSIAASAQIYANMLIEAPGCTIKHNYNGDSYGGENLAMNYFRGSARSARTPAEVLTAWYDDEIDLVNMKLVGKKYHAAQVVFRSTNYLGCGTAEKQHDRGTCHIQVCRYVRAGNCFLEPYVSQHSYIERDLPTGCLDDHPDTEWLCSALGDDVAKYCQHDDWNPRCPSEGCF